jgi:hypothetical protein
MGGKPNKGTKRDRRLKVNQKPKPRRKNGLSPARRRWLRRING